MMQVDESTSCHILKTAEIGFPIASIAALRMHKSRGCVRHSLFSAVVADLQDPPSDAEVAADM